MTKAVRLITGVAMVALSLAAAAHARPTRASLQEDKPPGSFELVGHNPLMNRGMNAALAVRGDYVYIGSRTDAKDENNSNNAGVFVVGVKDPTKPEIVYQIGPPEEGNIGETSRELRIWQSKDILIVMNLFSNCGEIHGCTPVSGDDNFRFYDISGEKAKEPKLISEYVPTEDPHEFYVWEDPKNPKRALMFMSTPGGNEQAVVADISAVPSGGKVKELAKWSALIPDPGDNRLHSMAVTPDGKVGYMSYLEGGFFLTDTSDFAANDPKPKIKELTPLANRVHWGAPGTHSGVPMFGKSYALTSDEVYGEALRALGGHGCPWGWVRTVDIEDPRKLKVSAEYKILPYNDPSYCDTSQPRPTSSFSSHNPTLTENLALISWHSGGLQAIDISNPEKPTQAAEFLPEPLPAVVQEDPVLSSGEDKVVIWSFPVVQDGLIYVIDIRNGLYILKYKGPFESEVSSLNFLEGNSNQGDAMKLWNASGSGGGGGGGGGGGTACTIVGDAKRDVLRGTDGSDVICGRGGRDAITGARGNDVIKGGAGDDRIEGGRGRDTIYGGKGGDTCIGGPGRDRIRSCKGRS